MLQEAGGADYRPGGNAATIPLEEMGTPDELITTAITLDERQLDAKVRAMRAHRTQMHPHSPINRLSPDALRAWLGTERFVRAYPPGAPRDGGEHDLFAAVRLDG
jgi:N-acetyl-1-D-myo-inositol-2-amino-2-deoxy-alpha-D-glucopyranoside deacetylase